eukprot:23573-Rhodomonas_salina.1
MTWLPTPRHTAPILPLQLTWSDWERYVRRLPHRKAGGEDGVTYELVREAPLRLQQVILEGVNAMLTGKALLQHWKGGLGVIQLLTKLDHNSHIENLSPVTLLQVADNHFTSSCGRGQAFPRDGGRWHAGRQPTLLPTT